MLSLLCPACCCSCVGVWQNDRVEIIANDQGNRTTPSYVAFTDTERLIGDAAKNQVAMNPRNTVSSGTLSLLPCNIKKESCRLHSSQAQAQCSNRSHSICAHHCLSCAATCSLRTGWQFHDLRRC